MIDLSHGLQNKLSELGITARLGSISSPRMVPLRFRSDVLDLLSRRSFRFERFDIEHGDSGVKVSFSKSVGAGLANGEFEISNIGDNFGLLISSLDSLNSQAGPDFIRDHAFPWANRPFMNFTELLSYITAFAHDMNLRMTSISATGYHRVSQESRRDSKRQEPNHAVEEMREQNRALHKMRIGFYDRFEAEIFKATFDRNLAVIVHVGDPSIVARQVLLPALRATQMKEKNYGVVRSQNFNEQQVLTMSFPPKSFETRDSMNAICQAIRKGDGISVTVMHLNPYLHAQVLDNLGGTVYDLMILDDSTLSLIPQVANDPASLERVSHLISRYFLEPTGEERQSVVAN